VRGFSTVPVASTSGSDADLLDANESTWAFVRVDCVCCLFYMQVRGLGALSSVCRS
jgi:hypothetical protein